MGCHYPVSTRVGLVVSVIITTALAPGAHAGNPIIQTNFTADPAPLVYKGKVYLYTSHDEDDAHNFKMRDWRLYSSSDMVNWTDHGTVASLATFPWARQDNDAWAPQVIERDGQFYLYVPISVQGEPMNVIAVAVANSPYGPFKDALGHPLIAAGQGNIDPTVAIDRDGQAYLYWGNPELWRVNLNRDMVSYRGPIQKIAPRIPDYQEGPWFYRRGDHYYLAFASTCCPEGIGYAMSAAPTGPWIYRGAVMGHDPGSSGNHPGIIDYRGHSYVFGFNYRLNFALTPEHRERRSVTLAEFKYAPDGTIPELPWWSNRGVSQLGTLDPFRRVEAETIAWTSGIDTTASGEFNWSQGVRTARKDTVGMYVTHVLDGTYIEVSGVDFRDGAGSTFQASVASQSTGSFIDVRVDSLTGPLVASLPIVATGGPDNWRVLTSRLERVSGVLDVFLIFRGAARGPLFDFDFWRLGPGSS